ncbi:MAG: heat-inducible transcription repressor HrcA [Chloroflexi bacterium]|nr:heat-inducible transcription repressor HrcA [Chloroflexota bacterium]
MQVLRHASSIYLTMTSTEPSAPTLSTRQQAIFGLVVREFTHSAEPVGSLHLVQKYQLEISSATVRSEMKKLEEWGYLTHPHTSAGRIPTHKGYRFFVQHLLPETSLPATVQHTIRHQFYQVQQELDQWVRLAANVLARTSHSAAITTVPRPSQAQFKHTELISLQPRALLMVLVLAGGTVRQQLLALDDTWSQDELSRMSESINKRLLSLDWQQISVLEPESDSLERKVVDMIGDILYHEDQRHEQIYRDGLTNVLQSPEFADHSTARRFIELFEEPTSIAPIIQEARHIAGVQVIIVGDSPYDDLPDISLVLSRYGQPHQTAGILGIIGPIRMPYGRTISTVRFMSQLMSTLTATLYGELEALEAPGPDLSTDPSYRYPAT